MNSKYLHPQHQPELVQAKGKYFITGLFTVFFIRQERRGRYSS
jgi:hypothetical protein